MAGEAARRSHQRKERRMMGVREFRDTFPSLDEEVEVIRSRRPYIEVLGVWRPNPNRRSGSSTED